MYDIKRHRYTDMDGRTVDEPKNLKAKDDSYSKFEPNQNAINEFEGGDSDIPPF